MLAFKENTLHRSFWYLYNHHLRLAQNTFNMDYYYITATIDHMTILGLSPMCKSSTIHSNLQATFILFAIGT